MKAVCSGSFDPVPLGHINVFERASRMFDELIVGVFHNVRKNPFFTVDERVQLIEEATRHIGNISVHSFSGLIPDFMRAQQATVIVRGLRSVTDFEYEVQQAQMIKHLAPEVETIFIMTGQEYSYVSSSAIRELAAFQGKVSDLVPACVERAVREKVARMSFGTV